VAGGTCGIAYGSAVETAELLRLVAEAEVLPDADARRLLDHANHACRLLIGLLKRRRGSV
jgi:four helix bundle protein